MGATRWARFRRLLGPAPEGDVDDELSFHVEMHVQTLVRRGETPARARELALRRFGDYAQLRDECVTISRRRARDMARTEYLAELKQDVRYALRALRRAPGFTLVAALTLALGIGSISAIFSVVQGVLLAPLPYRAPAELHDVHMIYPDGTEYSALSAPDFMSVREGTRSFARVEAYASRNLTLLGVGEPREVSGARVSGGLFGMLGLRVALGRGFLPEENQPGRGTVVVLGDAFWRRELGADPAVVGRTLSLGGEPYRVVGVLAPGARLLGDADLYAPLEYDESFSATTDVRRRSEFLRVLGRARPDAPPAQLAADLTRIGTALQTAFPASNERLTFGTTPLRDVVVGDVQRPLLVLFAAVALVLLVACANVANLLLARASTREGELAVRAALGAGRGRLVRQLLTEALVLGLAGGAIGLVIAVVGTRALVAAQPADIPRLDQVRVNGAVVLFTLGCALLTSLLFGAVPALQATGARLARSLREGGRGGAAGAGGHRVRAALVVTEMALAVTLLTGAGLLIRSFVALTRVDPGFRAEQAIGFRISLQGEAYGTADARRAATDALLGRLRALPGVSDAAASTVLPLGGLGSIYNFDVGGAPPPPNVNAEIVYTSVTPEYFHAIGAPVTRGRPFGDADRADAPKVAVINEAAVRRWIPSGDPIGTRVNVGADERVIVGVVGDVLQQDPGTPTVPQLFVPYAQQPARSPRIVLRTTLDPLALAPAIQREVRAFDPALPVAELAPLDELVSRSVARPRFYTALLALFAGVALALAATGIFGVMSYSVAQRAREISIRLALGARAGAVVRMVVGRALGLAAVGLALGAVAAAGFGRLLQSQLFGVGAFDPLTLGAVVLVLGASALLASWLPARRAAALDPGEALRGG